MGDANTGADAWNTKARAFPGQEECRVFLALQVFPVVHGGKIPEGHQREESPAASSFWSFLLSLNWRRTLPDYPEPFWSH